MKAIKRSIGVSMSALLLISFSMILFPLDFFHNHEVVPRQTHTTQKNSSSTHDINVQNKADYCWVCSVHFDKSFTKTTLIEKIQVSHAFSAFSESDFPGYFVTQLFATLRGPPSE